MMTRDVVDFVRQWRQYNQQYAAALAAAMAAGDGPPGWLSARHRHLGPLPSSVGVRRQWQGRHVREALQLMVAFAHREHWVRVLFGYADRGLTRAAWASWRLWAAAHGGQLEARQV